MNFPTTLKLPSALLPLAMSVAAIVVVLGDIALSGAVRHADEGAAAHFWQLLVGGQVPIVAYFAVRWLPRTPRSAFQVLALQAVAFLAALAPVYLLHL
ncbi:MAG TPA: hypothetical protein VGN24_09020 [Rhodanobacter sp.]|jgi:hypothetical protein|nr:hypothetical protein [Rhodanobacter sp.]